MLPQQVLQHENIQLRARLDQVTTLAGLGAERIASFLDDSGNSNEQQQLNNVDKDAGETAEAGICPDQQRLPNADNQLEDNLSKAAGAAA